MPIKYDASAPTEIPTGYSGQINNETITLKFPELTFSAQVQAYNWDGQYLLKPLGVWITFDAHDGSLFLDPQGVLLKVDGGDNLGAISFLGPSEPWYSPRALAAGCGPRRYHTGIAITNIAVSQESVVQANNSYRIFRPSKGPVKVEGEKCFMFWFDIDSQPYHSFLLTIDSVTVNDTKVPIPKIQFEKKALTSWRGIP